MPTRAASVASIGSLGTIHSGDAIVPRPRVTRAASVASMDGSIDTWKANGGGGDAFAWKSPSAAENVAANNAAAASATSLLSGMSYDDEESALPPALVATMAGDEENTVAESARSTTGTSAAATLTSSGVSSTAAPAGEMPKSSGDKPWWRRRGIAAGIIVIVLVVVVAVSVVMAQQSNPNPEEANAAVMDDDPAQLSTSTSSPAPTSSPSATVITTDDTTDEPTAGPTYEPSSSPSIDPSVSPTDVPTISPTMLPTRAPNSCWAATLDDDNLSQMLLDDAPAPSPSTPAGSPPCTYHTAIDGTSAVVTTCFKVYFFDLIQVETNIKKRDTRSWNRTWTYDIDASRILIPAISGSIAVVGAPKEDEDAGAAYVFEKTTTTTATTSAKNVTTTATLITWQLQTRLTPDDNNGGGRPREGGAQFGEAVAIEGIVVAVGASGRVDKGEEGAEGEEEGSSPSKGGGSAYVFRRRPFDSKNGNDEYDDGRSAWRQEAELTPPSVYGFTNAYASTLALRGNVLAVSDPWYGDDERGAVFVFEYSAFSKSWKTKFINEDGDAALFGDYCDKHFGITLALAEDKGGKDGGGGAALLVGCVPEESAASVFHYGRNNEGTQQPQGYVLQQEITASDDYQWYNPSVFADWHQLVVHDKIMVVGAWKGREYNDDGRVYVYSRTSSSTADAGWTEELVIYPPSGETRFGDSVAISRNRVIVGAEKSAYAYTIGGC